MTILIEHEYHGVLVGTFPDSLYTWLDDKMGKSGERWFTRHRHDGTMIYFRDQRDHLLFLMAWGQ